MGTYDLRQATQQAIDQSRAAAVKSTSLYWRDHVWSAAQEWRVQEQPIFRDVERAALEDIVEKIDDLHGQFDFACWKEGFETHFQQTVSAAKQRYVRATSRHIPRGKGLERALGSGQDSIAANVLAIAEQNLPSIPRYIGLATLTGGLGALFSFDADDWGQRATFLAASTTFYGAMVYEGSVLRGYALWMGVLGGLAVGGALLEHAKHVNAVLQPRRSYAQSTFEDYERERLDTTYNTTVQNARRLYDELQPAANDRMVRARDEAASNTLP